MAITVTPAEIITRLPEFAGLTAVAIQPWLDQAILRVNETEWAGKANEGVIFLTAHLLRYFTDPDCAEPDAGAVSAEREGAVSTSYAIADHIKDGGALASTKYGRHFLTLRRELFVNRKVG